MQLRDIKHAHTFPAIAARYEQATPWRSPDHPEGSRPAGVNRKKYVSIRPIQKNEAGDITAYACRYHQTDVVRWYLDAPYDLTHDLTPPPEGVAEGRSGREMVLVDGYSSLSTNTFASAFTPANLRFDFAHDDGFFAYVTLPTEKRVYEFKSHLMRFVRDQTHNNFFVPMPEDCAPYTFIDTRSPLMRVALTATKYPDFSKWLNAVASFDSRPYAPASLEGSEARRQTVREADNYFRDHTPLDALADPDAWMHLWATSTHATDAIRSTSVVARREAILQNLREAIYAKNSLPPTHDMEYATVEQHNQQRQARKKFA